MVSATESGFLAEIESCKDMWRSIDLRIVAIRDSGVGWRSEGLRATLLADETITLREDLPEHPDILAIHQNWPIDYLGDLFAMLDSGALAIGRETIVVKQFAGNDQWQPLSTFWIRRYDRAASRAKFGLDWRTVVLEAYETTGGAPNWQRAREFLDGQLQVSNPPWNGVADLRHAFLGQPADEATRWDLRWVEVVAPIEVRFGNRSVVEGAELKLHTEAASTVAGKDVVAGILVTRGDETVARRRIVFRNRDRPFPKSGVFGRVSLPREFSSVLCTLAYRGNSADRLSLYGTSSGDERLQWTVFGAAVGGPSDLLEALQSDAARGDPFEHAVATLFHLLGFVTAHYGRNTFPRGGDLPDIVAFAPDRNWFLVVECTARDLDYGAVVSKLVTRTQEIRATAPDFEVQPVLVVKQPRETVLATARDVAIRERVALLTEDNIRDLVGLAIANLPPDKVKDFLVGLIPSPDPFGRR